MKPSARWTLTVSADTDRRVRRVLASLGRKGDLSAFVEEAMRSRLLELAMKTAPSNPGFACSANDVDPIVEDDTREERDGSSYGG
jgi:hypothetical protein